MRGGGELDERRGLLLMQEVDAESRLPLGHCGYVGLQLGDAAVCGNPRLAEILGSLAPQTIRYTKLAIVSRRRREESAKAWQNLLRVAKKGDAAEAAATAEGLVENARRAAHRVIEERSR